MLAVMGRRGYLEATSHNRNRRSGRNSPTRTIDAPKSAAQFLTQLGVKKTSSGSTVTLTSTHCDAKFNASLHIIPKQYGLNVEALCCGTS